MSSPEVWNVVVAVFLSVGGAGGLIVVLAKFFGERAAEKWLEGVKAKHATELVRVQHELDRAIEGARADHATELARTEHELNRMTRQVQARLDHAVTVSRAQFEVELRALQEVWSAVSNVRSSLLGVVEILSPEDDAPESRHARFEVARSRFIIAHSELVTAVDHNSAFYSETVYAIVDALRGRTTLEKIELLTHRTSESGWHDQRSAAVDDVLRGAEHVSAAIRARLASLSIARDGGDSPRETPSAA